MLPLLLFFLAQDPLPEGAAVRLAGHSEGLRAVAWSSDGRFILTGSRDCTMALWDASTGKRLRQFEGHREGVTSVAFSPDGRQVLSGSQDQSMALWELDSGKRIRVFEGHAGWIKTVAFASGGKRILSASLDRTVATWEVDSGKKLSSFDVHPTRVLSVAFSPDGRSAAAGNEDKEAYLFDVATGNREKLLVAHFWWNRSVAFSPDGRRLLVGSSDQTATLFDPATGAAVQVLTEISGLPWGIAVSPDGTRAAIGTQGQTVEIHDLVRGKKSRSFEGHAGQVSSVAFSPGGARVVSTSEDGTAIVWNLLPDESERIEAWRRLDPADQLSEVRSLAKILGGAQEKDRARAQALLLAAGDLGVRAILDVYPPEPAPRPPTVERQKDLLRLLDDDDFETRVKARSEIKSFGAGALAWIEKELANSPGLSPEVQETLRGLRREILVGGSISSDPGRVRAIFVLLELSANDSAREALAKYALGPYESYASNLARRALGK